MPDSDFCAVEFFFFLLTRNDLHVHYFLYIRKTTPRLQFGTTHHTVGVKIGQTANGLVKKIKLRKLSSPDRHTNIDNPGEMIGKN